MCGIAGLVYKNPSYKAEIGEVKKMTDAIAHRGPDGEGQWAENNIALGHRRLSIIDLDNRSNQPMISGCKNYVIIFNGEIYNYLEIKEELQRQGVEFSTESDTEVIIEAYKYYGKQCFEQFNGMWALCIYDKKKKELIFSRDRFGIKPLYILENQYVLAFASEVKGILTAFPEENIQDNVMLYRFLAGTVNEDVDEHSYYKNIKIFPRATYMVYGLNDYSRTYIKYWNVDEELFYEKWVKGKNPIKQFRNLFNDSIRLRLRSDVEIGACLSGGIDSSAIVGCALNQNHGSIHTFTSVYKDKECDEREYAECVNQSCHTNSHYIEPDEEEKFFEEYIQRINYYHDGPVRGASLYSQYMVMKEASKYVKVVLDGQGADELFAGYIRYYSSYISDLINQHNLRGRIKAINLLIIVKNKWPKLLNSIATNQIVDLLGIYNSFMFTNSISDKIENMYHGCKMFSDNFMHSVEEKYKADNIRLSSELNTRLCMDIITNAIPGLLHNEDSNSMAFSIESRVPFLDYRLVEFSLALNAKYKIRRKYTKWIVREGCKKYIPRKVRKRTDKMGFPAPFARWLINGESAENIKEIIMAFAERDIVPKETVCSFYDKHISGEVDVSNVLFKYYSAELWLRTCNN